MVYGAFSFLVYPLSIQRRTLPGPALTFGPVTAVASPIHVLGFHEGYQFWSRKYRLGVGDANIEHEGSGVLAAQRREH